MRRMVVLGILMAALAGGGCGGGGGAGPSAGGGGGGGNGGSPPPGGPAPDPPLVDFDRFGLREPAAATLAAFEAAGQLAAAAADAVGRSAGLARFPASVPCTPGTADTSTNALDLDLTDANQDGRVGPGDTVRATWRECRSTAFGGARLTGTASIAVQTPAPYSGPDAPDEILDLLTQATALRAQWAAGDEVVLDGGVASRDLAGRPFRLSSWTTSSTPLRARVQRAGATWDLGLRGARTSKYHDYREGRTSLSVEGEVLERASAGGFRLTAASTATSMRLNQFPQAGQIVLRGAGTSRAALTARVGELVLELDRDGDGTYELRNQDMEAWTLGSKGFMFWDPFTARPSSDAYAIGTNPNDALERLVTQPDLSAGSPTVAPTQTFRQYWSRRLDAGSFGAIRFYESPAGASVPAVVVLEGALLEFTPAAPLTRGATYEARTDGPLVPGAGAGGVILAQFQVAP